jgi:hypothetical protein
LAIEIVDHADECSGTVGRPKGHDGVSPFDSVGSLECKFFLAGDVNSELMVS